MNDSTLWAVHISGPDDIHAAPSHEEATARAAQINEWYSARENKSENDPLLEAAVTPWPYDAATHAADLLKWHDLDGPRDDALKEGK